MGSYDEVGVSVPLVAEEHLHDQPDGSPDLPVHVEPVQLQLAADGSRGLEGSKGIRIAIQNLKTNVLFTLKTRGQNIALEHPFLSLDNYNIFSLFKEFLHAHVLLRKILATAFSKSPWVTWTFLSLSVYMPASVQTHLTSAPELPPICSSIFPRLIPLVKFIHLQ